MLRRVAAVCVCIVSVLAWTGTSLAAGFQEELRALDEAHLARWQARLGALNAAARESVMADFERVGRAVGTLGFDRSETGALRYLGGVDLREPSSTAASWDEAGYQFMEAHPGLFSMMHPRALFRVQKIVPTTGGVHVVMTEDVRGLQVFGARIAIHLGHDSTFRGFTGTYVPEELLPDSVPVLAASPGSRPGIFHGSLFGLDGWQDRVAEPAYKVRGHDEAGLPVYRFISALDGSELLSVPGVYTDAPSDSYYSPNGSSMPGTVMRLDSTQTCGSGTYPYCNYQGTSLSDWLWVSILGSHFADRYGRDSWNDQQVVPDCTPNPYHRMESTSDVNIAGTRNALWDIGLCEAGIGTAMSSCYDVIGHEFGHGLQEADMDMTPTYGRHSSALSEGLSDVVGEFYEEWLTGDPDWLSGSGTGCQYTRNLAEPSQSLDNNGNPIVEPEHASQFQPPVCFPLPGAPCGDHFDATIAGKAANLLGRYPSAGSETHWGIPVTGIGGTDASLVFYGAINQYLNSAPTFSDLRDAMLDSADDAFGSASNQYSQTRWTVDAMGFWTHKSDFGFLSSQKPTTAYFTVNGEARRYVFTVESGYLKYRYRTCTYYGVCSWSAPTTVYSVTNGASAVVHDGVLWVFWDLSNSVYYKKYYSDGSSSSVFVRSGASTSVAPTAVHIATNLLWLFYRDVAPLSQAATVRRMALNGSTWGSAVATAAASRGAVSAISLYGDVHMFYRSSPYLNVVFRVYDDSTQTWSAEHTAVAEAFPALDDAYGPSVAYYRGRIHLVANTKHASPYGMTDGSYLRSCVYPCLGDAWTPEVNIDGNLDPSTRWSYLFPEDSHLLRADYVEASGSNPAQMTWRWKNSE